jgi:hypothetical protein
VSKPELNDRQRKFVDGVAGGMKTQQAARAAGFAPSYARKASRLLKIPMIAAAVEAIREKGRDLAAYGLVEAMREADDAAAFAKLHKNPMALVKAFELKAKLSGLLIDRVEVATVDLRGALEAAERRVINVTNVTNGASSPVGRLPLPTHGSTRWSPPIPGDQEDPEAGLVDGESVRQVNKVGPEIR